MTATVKNGKGIKKSNVQYVDYANVHWFKANNIRTGERSWGDPMADFDFRYDTGKGEDGQEIEKLVSSAKGGDRALVALLWEGWNDGQGSITVERATSKQKEAALAERKETIALLKKKEKTLSLAMALEAVWFPNGKAAPIDWIANNCYRRSEGIKGVMLRRRMDADGGDFDTSYALPIVSKEFGEGSLGAINRLDDHLAENLLKDAGRKQLQPVDYFLQAVQYRKEIGASFRESDLTRRNVKKGEAQRAFALCQLNADFPELNLVDRVKIATPAKGEYKYVKFASYIDVSKLRHADLVRLKNGTVPGVPGDTEKKIGGGRSGKLHAIEKYIERCMVGGRPAALTIADAKTALKDNRCHLAQYLGTRLDDEETAGKFAEELGEHAEAINKALDKVLAKLMPQYADLLTQEAEVEEKAKETAAA